jgi:carboxylate-amine ligase
MRIVAAGTHPFSDWKKQEITDGERYKVIVEDLQDVARANLIFGLHVHVGIKDKEVAMALANQVRYFLPHILALSTSSSPFWLGRSDGAEEHPQRDLQALPAHGHPRALRLVRASSSVRRPPGEDGLHRQRQEDLVGRALRIPFFDTVEVRICDMTTRIDDTLAIAALIQAMMGKLYLLYRRNLGLPRVQPRAHRGEQVARGALRLDGQLIDFGKQEQVPTCERSSPSCSSS